MSKTTTSLRKPYSEMNAKELAEATAEYDREMPGLPGKPLSADGRRLHRAAKMGRPVKGEGAQTVAVSIERGLLKQADAIGKRRKLGRSALFSEALQALLMLERSAPVSGKIGTKGTSRPSLAGRRR
jgi:hypothetical protein